MMPKMSLSVGRNIKDNSPTAYTFDSVDELFESLLSPHGAEKDGRYFQLVKYGEGAHRNKAGVDKVYGYVGDIDTGDISADEIAEALAGTRAAVYSSYSSKDGDRRWRFVVPFAAPVSVSVFEAVHAHHFLKLFSQLDSRSGEAAQVWFWRREPREVRQYTKVGDPHRPPGPFMPWDEAFELDDELLDAWSYAELAQAPRVQKSLPIQPPRSLGIKEEQIDDIITALDSIDGTDREQWFRVMCALHSTGDDSAWDILDGWSQQFASYDPVENATQWGSLSREKVNKLSLASLFYDAAKVGWRSSKLRRGVMPAEEEVTEDAAFFMSFKDLVTSPDVPPEWTISGVFERGTLASIFGATGSYKSFMTIDMAVHVAAGKEWHGRPVRQGGVVYLCGEGVGGMSRRMKAAQRYHDLPEDLPLVVSKRAKNLMREDERHYVHSAIDSAIESWSGGVDVEMIVIDTRRRFMSGDGNKDEDVDVFRDACDSLKLRYGCLVLVVHHTGHGELSRAKGASGWTQDLDDEYRMSATSDLVASFSDTKGKERPGGAEFTIEFESIALDITDWDNTSVASLAVKSFGSGMPVMAHTSSKTSQRARKVLACYHELLDSQQKLAGRSNVMVTTNDLIERLYPKHYSRRDKARFAVDATVQEGQLSTEGIHVWIDDSELPF